MCLCFRNSKKSFMLVSLFSVRFYRLSPSKKAVRGVDLLTEFTSQTSIDGGPCVRLISVRGFVTFGTSLLLKKYRRFLHAKESSRRSSTRIARAD